MELQAKLKFWLEKNWNVLLIGKHGIGKTALVKKAFEDDGMSMVNLDEEPSINARKYIYFSASTMDVWADLIGIPEKKCREKNGEAKYYLDYLRPEYLKDIEAIFIDELNRPSSSKLNNAVMQLIQFKSINGYKFPKLRVVWAAINPADDPLSVYQVEILDPSQEDRFQIQYHMADKPDYEYFVNKFGEKNAEAAITWWHELSEDEKILVSPRRLDYVLEIYNAKGDIRDALKNKVNVSKLLTQLKTEPVNITLNTLFESNDESKIINYLANENNFKASIDNILKKKEYISFFLPYMTQEKKMILMNQSSMVRKSILLKPSYYIEEVALFVKNYPKHSWSKKVKKEILAKFYFNLDSSWDDMSQLLSSEFVSEPATTIQQRKAKFNLLKKAIPCKLPHPSNVEILKLKNILIKDIFIPSHKKTIEEELPELVKILYLIFANEFGFNFDKDNFVFNILNNIYGDNFVKKWIEVNK